MKRDENLPKMKSLIQAILPGCNVILFGSRSRGDFDCLSDYDLLVVSDIPSNTREKRQYAGKIRRKISALGIPADVIVRTQQDVNFYKDKIGSIVQAATLEGVTL